MPFQNVPDCVVCEIVAQVGQCSLYPSISPGAILLSHADSQSGDFVISWRPARTPTWTLRVLNNQFSVPRQQSFRRGDRCHLPQRLAAKLFSFGQSPSLVIVEPEASVTHLSRKTRFSSIRYAMTFCWFWLIQPAIVVTRNENGSKDARIGRYYGRNSREISTQSSQRD